MKKYVPEHEHYAREHNDPKSIAELSGRLAPPEESDDMPKGESQSLEYESDIGFDTGSLKIPQGYVEYEQAKRGLFGLEPVIIVIMFLMMAFICFIAYLVYQMPAPVK